MTRYQYNYGQRQSAGWRTVAVVIGLILSLFAGIFGAIFFIADGMTFQQEVRWWAGSNYSTLTPIAIWTVLLLPLIAGVVAIFSSNRVGERVGIAVVLITLAAGVITPVSTIWDNDKDFARYYNSATTVFIDGDPDEMTSVKRLMSGITETSANCAYKSKHDVDICIKQGMLPMDGWKPRAGSLQGATNVIRNASGDVNNVSLNEDTLAYADRKWSGVLDGHGKHQSMGGVAEWTGKGKVHQCLFDSKYELDRAFGGERGNSLTNLLADRYPGLNYSMSDVYGYCEGDEPIVIVPTVQRKVFKSRTVETYGGIIVIQGDNGKTKLTHVKNPTEGTYKGGLYPASLVTKQVDSFDWAAGRKNKNAGFGLEPTDSSDQEGNVDNYLLTNAKTGRLEWVTPLTLKSSSSEIFVGYAVSPADEGRSGHLTKLDLYILDKDDPRRVNIDTLVATARNYLANNAGMFISNGGKLVEFTPIDGNRWRGFAELNGRVVSQMDISADASIPTTLVQLDDTPEGPETTETTLDCSKNIDSMTVEDLTKCVDLFVGELSDRAGQSANGGQGSEGE
jgi:hypothetical protein